jgi:hypothetical protein
MDLNICCFLFPSMRVFISASFGAVGMETLMTLLFLPTVI